jgi:hypothetical protein
MWCNATPDPGSPYSVSKYPALIFSMTLAQAAVHVRSCGYDCRREPAEVRAKGSLSQGNSGAPLLATKKFPKICRCLFDFGRSEHTNVQMPDFRRLGP